MGLDTSQNLVSATLVGTLAQAAAELTVDDVSRFPAAPNYAVIWDKTASPNGPPAGAPATTGVEIVRYGAIDTGNDKLTSLTRGQDGTSDVAHATAGQTYGVAWDITSAFLGQIRVRLWEVDATNKLAAWGTDDDDTYKVGIGESAPVRKLHVKATPDDYVALFESDSWSGIVLKDPSQEWVVASGAGPFIVRDHTGGSLDILKIAATTPADTFCIQSSGYIGVGQNSAATLLELYEKEVISSSPADEYSGAITLDPEYEANSASSFTITRHNYIDVNNVTAANIGAGTLTVTDAAIFRFDAAPGTHKAVDSATTKTSPGTVNGWLKVNCNGTLYSIPMYTSQTS